MVSMLVIHTLSGLHAIPTGFPLVSYSVRWAVLKNITHFIVKLCSLRIWSRCGSIFKRCLRPTLRKLNIPVNKIFVVFCSRECLSTNKQPRNTKTLSIHPVNITGWGEALLVVFTGKWENFTKKFRCFCNEAKTIICNLNCALLA